MPKLDHRELDVTEGDGAGVDGAVHVREPSTSDPDCMRRRASSPERSIPNEITFN